MLLGKRLVVLIFPPRSFSRRRREAIEPEMEALLYAVWKNGLDGARKSRKQRHLLLHVARQSAHDQNACDQPDRAYKEQKLRPATHGHQIKSRVSAAED